MTTEITLFQPQEMSFDMPQVALPRLRIDKNTGEFVHDYGDRTPELHAVVIKAHEISRVMWPDKFKIGNQPLCKSNDGLAPVERDPEKTPYGALDETGLRTCTGCEMAEWIENGQERIKPPCAVVLNLLLLDIETEMPGVLALARTRFRTGQNLSSFWSMTNFRFSVILTTYQHTGDSGTWYMVEFKRGPKFEPEQSRALHTLYRQVQDWNLAAVASELTQQDIEENGHQPAAANGNMADRVETMRGPQEDGID